MKCGGNSSCSKNYTLVNLLSPSSSCTPKKSLSHSSTKNSKAPSPKKRRRGPVAKNKNNKKTKNQDATSQATSTVSTEKPQVKTKTPNLFDLLGAAQPLSQPAALSNNNTRKKKPRASSGNNIKTKSKSKSKSKSKNLQPMTAGLLSHFKPANKTKDPVTTTSNITTTS